MRKRILLLVLIIDTFIVNAENRFYIEDFSIKAGETKEIAIILENDCALTAFETSIYLPECLTIHQEDGVYAFNLSERTSSKKHTLGSNLLSDGAIKLICYSTSLATFSSNEGALVNFVVTASEDFSGTHKIDIKNTKFSDVDSHGYVFPDSETNVEEGKGYTVGDANGDGSVTVSDIVMVANNIMGNTSNIFILEAADVNNDGMVSVTDIVMLSNIIMNNVS